MTDFVSDGEPFETPVGAANEGYASTPPSFRRAFGAMFGETSPIEMGERAVERGQYAGASWFDRALAVTGMANAGLAVPDAIQTPMLSPEEANKRYAPEGAKITDKPIPEGIARLIGKAKADEIERESVLNRFSAANSWPVTFGTGIAAFLLDPLNAATGFLPGVGEEAIAGGLARVGMGTGIAARTIARVGAGAASGAIAQAPLSAARYGFGQEEGSDYGLRDAFRDLMYSAAAGAIFHAGFGAVGDVLRARTPAEAAPIVAADATTKADAMRAAVSQMVDGREVDVQPVFDAKSAGAEPVTSPQALVDAQSGLYRDGYAPGIPQAEFDAAREDIYGGGREPVAEKPAAAQTSSPLDNELAGLERGLANRIEVGGVLLPEERAELDRTSSMMAVADLREQAYDQAAECLTEAGL